MDKLQSIPITIATFNCRSIKRSVEQIRSLCNSIDILALQETWLLPHDLGFVNIIDDKFGCFAKSAVDTSSGTLTGRPYGGLAIMWRRSLFPVVSIIDCLSDRLSAIQIDLDNRSIIIINVYLPYDDDKEESLIDFISCLGSIEALISDKEVEAVYVLGDYNAHPASKFGVELLSFCEEHKLICKDRELLAEDTYTHVNDGNNARRWVDHCIVTEAAQLTVVSAEVDYGVYWSDHYPLIMTCHLSLVSKKAKNNISNSQSQGIRWGCRDADQIKRYNKICHDKLKSLNLSSQCVVCNVCCEKICNEHLYLLDEFYDNIVKILQKAARDCKNSGARKRKKIVLGWNYHVRDYHQRARHCYNKWIINGRQPSGDTYVDMVRSRRAFKNKLKWCQNNEDSMRMNVLARHKESKNFMKFWKSTKELNYKNILPESVEGISDTRDIANLFSHHFKVAPLSAKTASELDLTGTATEKDSKRRISPREISVVVKRMKPNKAPGFDDLSVEHIKYAGENIYLALAQLFSACLNSGYLPSNIMRTMVVPVPKNKSGDASSVQNYRPISLGTVIGKIFESLLYPEVKSKLKLNDAQFGFRPGLSTDSAVFSLKSTVDYYRSRDTSVYACFLDLSRAFDLVNYNLLWKKLAVAGVTGETVDLLRFWYENQVNFVRWGDSTSSNYKLECGVRQGGLTSPDLFNLYVNDLIEELSSAKVGCHIGRTWLNNFSYADDMVLLSPSVNGLNKLLAICERYASEHGLKYNVKKTQMMVFKAGRGPDKVPPVYIDGTSVERVSKFRYLGHLLTEDCCDDEDIERERRALAVRCNMLARRFHRCNKDVKLTLFKAYCQCFYTCQLWVNCTRKARSSIRVQYNDAYRILMRLPRYCSASSMFADARVPDFFAILRARIAAFWIRIRGSSNCILTALSERYDNYIFKFWLSVHRDANRK